MSSGEYERLAGRYRVVRQLGRGGMGVVWRAVDEVLGREVAVKELRTYNDASGPELDDLRLRMQREARAAARVRHPGVVAVHDVTDHEGRPVIVMELVDGPSLDGVLGERGTLPPREVAKIGAAVLEALAAAHDVGVLHRDVKPGNVLLDRGGRVVLTDFGIAAMEDPGDGSATHLTRSGEIVGSLDYLAPERAQGQQPGPASDVWALGATLYAAVEGASPFRRTSTWSTLNAIVVEPLPEPRNAGPLAPVLQQLMHKDPAQRPDARTAARLLTAVAEGGDAPSGPAGPSFTTPPASTAPTAPPVAQAHLWVPTEPDAVPLRPEGAFGPAGSPAAPAAVPGFGAPTPAAPYGVPGGPVGPVGSAETGGAYGPGGSPAPLPAAGAFGAPTPAGTGAGGPAGPVTAPQGVAGGAAVPSRRAGRAGRSRSGVLIAAAVAAVLLIGGGVTYALIDRDGGAGQEQLADGRSPAGPDAGADHGRVLDPGAPGAGGAETGSPSASATPSKDGAKKSASPSPSARTTKAPVAGGSSGGTTTGGTTGGSGGTTGGSTTTSGAGGTATTPAPVCFARGGGKYDCQVWRTEKTYSHGGGQMGILNAGTNYFYCQSDLGRRETYGEWTNVWWARTDDDSGNTGVYFSVVYIKGGDNDQPLPGLPVC
ncbi:protein kinase [Streptomyces sp. NPDC006339]|uniref:serine/threonine-protein kinase n=1 Tax=Streptomyces sp. NPDC006339 TaxID=3156755 RepID=UPI0033A5E2A0